MGASEKRPIYNRALLFTDGLAKEVRWNSHNGTISALGAIPVDLQLHHRCNMNYAPVISDREGSGDQRQGDAYFSADVETDGPIPGPYSILSFALVYAGSFDGHRFERDRSHKIHFYRELRPISGLFQEEALSVNRLDRNMLVEMGRLPAEAMLEAYDWVMKVSNGRNPVLVAYPLSFDWSWLYWYFTAYSRKGSPFEYSRCFDIKTAFAVKAKIPIANSGRTELPYNLRAIRRHTHNALDDAIEQAEIFGNVFEWNN